MLQIGLLTMYNEDPSILNSTYFPLPEGIDHSTLDPLLLAETAELELLYPEPNTLKTVIYAWSMARNPAWAKMLEALESEYSPIENYDRSETWTDTRNLTDNHTGSENRQGTGQRTGTNNRQETSSSTGSDTESVVGYNETAWTNKDKHETTGGLNSSVNGSDNLSTSDTENRTDQAADTHTGTIQHTSRIHGNIGVTTAQQMITAELELRKMDVYNIIVKEFIKMFCLGVY